MSWQGSKSLNGCSSLDDTGPVLHSRKERISVVISEKIWLTWLKLSSFGICEHLNKYGRSSGSFLEILAIAAQVLTLQILETVDFVSPRS